MVATLSSSSRNASRRSLADGRQHMGAASHFRIAQRLETAAAKYALPNRPPAVGAAEIQADGLIHPIEEIL